MDKTFGKDGTTFFPSGNAVTQVALGKDGKISVVGYDKGTMITQFLKDGTIDSSFGENGQVFLNNFFYDGNCITVQSDGKIIVAVSDDAFTFGIVLYRFLPVGSPDPSFGEEGMINQKEGHGYDGVSEIAIDKNGKIFAGGSFISFDDHNFAVHSSAYRFNSDGRVDSTFGDNGICIVNDENAPQADILSMALGVDGKIVLAGNSGIGDSRSSLFFVARITADGKIDSSFSDNGYIYTNVAADGESAYDVAIQEDGKVIAVGTSQQWGFSGRKPHIALVRYNSDGSLDQYFGNKGIVELAINGKSYGNSVALQKNGKIVVGGRSLGSLDYDNFSVTRFLDNGNLDSSFGTYGYTLTDISGGEATSVCIQNDGRIVLAGNPSIALARYLGDPLHPAATRIKRWIKNHTLHFQDNNSNAAYYTVEQSNNEATGFTAISNKITANKNEYSYSLPASNSTSLRGGTTKQSQSYYRIKTVNKDNSFTYSEPIADNDQLTNQPINQLTISPNPVHDFLTINGLDASKKYEVRIMNKEGRQVYSANPFKSRGINVSSLQSGLYFIKINDGEKETSLKFIKQ